jgi:hypothetical protein
MIVLPIVERELRVAARRFGTYRARFSGALAAVILMAWAFWRFYLQNIPTAQQGLMLFYLLSAVALVYCLSTGPQMTADCVCEEKREGTLGLLFLTDLKGMDVVLGKLVASSLNALYGLLAIFPLLAMPLLLGGVTVNQFGKMVLTLLNTLFFSLAVGLLISSISRNERKAMFGAILAVLASIFIPLGGALFFVVIMEAVQNVADLQYVALILLGAPAYPFACVLWPGTGIPWTPPVWTFWCSLGLSHLTGWLALLAAARILPRVWKDQARAPKASNLADRLHYFSRGDRQRHEKILESRKTFRRWLLEINPYLWLVERDRLKTMYAWMFLLAMMAIWTWGYAKYGRVMFDFYPLAPTILIIHGFLKLWVVAEACHRLVVDQRSGALELLLSTPLSDARIIQGQTLALKRQFVWPLVVLGGIELWVFHGSYSVAIISSVLTMLAADLFTLAWVGMYLSLTAKNMSRVLGSSVLLVLVLPWVLYLLAATLWEALRTKFGLANEALSFEAKVLLWLVIGIINDVLLGMCWARPRLSLQFRSQVLKRFERGPEDVRWWLPLNRDYST